MLDSGIEIETPVFMPVGTQATVKALTPEVLHHIGAKIILCNSYHLYLRPGIDVLKKFENLHRFMNWNAGILTDSGGFQVFSLKSLRTMEDDGVVFNSHIDGSRHMLTPEKVIDIQNIIGSDIKMVLDDCVSYQEERESVEHALKRTLSWARRSKEYFEERESRGSLFSIVQGGMYKELREKCALELLDLDFDGYALGGLSVGEENSLMYEIVHHTTDFLPEHKPRYLMGVGTPADLHNCIAEGIDMFDCVMPTRNARNGMLFTMKGNINIKRQEYSLDTKPIEEDCVCYTCKNFSRSYLRHLFKSKEILASCLNSIHNIHFYLELMRKVREAIQQDRFMEFKNEFLSSYAH